MSRNKGSWLADIGLGLAGFALLFFLLFRGTLVDASTATKALAEQGYENIQVLKKNWFFITAHGCARSDAAKFLIKAKNLAKKDVEMSVCVSWPFKGVTMRID